MFSKGISQPFTARNGSKPRGFWHLTLCTLLSSQGTDTPTSNPQKAVASRQLIKLTHPATPCQIRPAAKSECVKAHPNNHQPHQTSSRRVSFYLRLPHTDPKRIQAEKSEKSLVPREAGKHCGFPHLWGTSNDITVPTPDRQNHTPPGRVTPRTAEQPGASVGKARRRRRRRGSSCRGGARPLPQGERLPRWSGRRSVPSRC